MNGILVVDDDRGVRDVLRALLSDVAGLTAAADGAEALRLAAAERPKLMLLDIAMPGMGGISVLRSALELQPSMTVWMLTAECDIAMAKGALDAGARAYITKPFDGPALRAQVEDLFVRESGAAGAAPEKPWHIAG